MTESRILTLAAIEDLAFRALVAAGTSEQNARPLAIATAATEADGVASHGLAYIPIYVEHLQCGKVDGQAKPVLDHPRPGVVTVNAATGFAHPAIDLGFEQLVPLAGAQGVAALSIRNSYNCGVLGYHTQRLARAGLVGLGFTNAPASIAPSGGSKPVVGTNPISIAVPGADGEPSILIDQSASTIAKSELMKRAREGKSIPVGWALNKDGEPTTDPNLGLQGSMAPSGGYKGVGIGLLVEIMAAALSGANLGIHAAPFSGTAGGPPRTGQFFLAIDPGATSGPGAISCPGAASGNGFASRIADLVRAVHDQNGAHLPGDGRKGKRAMAQQRGVEISMTTLNKIYALVSEED